MDVQLYCNLAILPVRLVYSLTMQEVNGNDASPANSFGMIFRFNQQTKGNTTITSFL